MGGTELKLIRSGRWKLHVRTPQPGFRCLEDASGWKDQRGPDGITIIAQFEQADPTQCPGVQTGPPAQAADAVRHGIGPVRTARCRFGPSRCRPASQGDLRPDRRPSSCNVPDGIPCAESDAPAGRRTALRPHDRGPRQSTSSICSGPSLNRPTRLGCMVHGGQNNRVRPGPKGSGSPPSKSPCARNSRDPVKAHCYPLHGVQ